MQCAFHPDREPVGACVSCGKLICVECKALLGGKLYCSPCADKIFVQGKTESTPPGKLEPASTRSQPKVETKPAYVVVNKAEPVTMTARNTSGQGVASTLPDELRGWNWGAFFLNWIWGIGNNVWIALLTFVLGIIWSIVLGAKGNEWAWQHKKWDSIEHFKKTQRAWKKWGLGLFIAGTVIGIIYIIFIVIVLATGIGDISF